MLDTISNLTLVGAGKMGMALARGWLDAGLKPSALRLVDPNPHESVVAYAKERGISVYSEAPEGACEIVLLAVKPQVINMVLDEFSSRIGPQTLVLSIAAGISLAQLSEICCTQRVVRTMPNTPAQVGKGVTGLVRGPAVEDKDWDIAKALFAASGTVVELPDESDIDALTAVSGSGPAYVFHMVEALAAAGMAEGLSPESATVLARQTVIGAAALMDADPTDAGTLRENVTSPNGVTYEALKVLMNPLTGMPELFRRAIKAAKDRSIEMGS